MWIFQILVDCVLVSGVVMALSWRRRIADLERELIRLRAAGSVPALSKPIANANLSASNSSTHSSSLSERVQGPSVAGSRRKVDPEAFEKADQLISQGIHLGEVAKRTGLSLAELQLLGKVTQRSQ